jgi:hypothetical protein
VRHSAGVHEPNVEELRTLFTESASALEQARRFRDERLEVIQSESGPRPLVNDGRIILHIVPIASFSGAVAVDVEDVHQNHQAFSPMGSPAHAPRFNYYGFINERVGEENHGYTQIFRNGALEATKASIIRDIDGRRIISGPSQEQHIFQALSSYILGLRDVGVPPPLIIMLTLEGTLGVTYVVQNHVWPDDYEPPFPEDVLVLPECVLEDYGEDVDHHRAVRPAFDALWNAIGYSRSQFFNDEGLWVGRVRPG